MGSAADVYSLDCDCGSCSLESCRFHGLRSKWRHSRNRYATVASRQDSDVNPALWALISSCLHPDPGKRISAAQVAAELALQVEEQQAQTAGLGITFPGME